MVYDAVARHKSGILSMDSFKKMISQEHLSSEISFSPPSEEEDPLIQIFGQFPTLKKVENYVIEKALKLSKGNQGIAASLLGITRQALNRRLIRKKQ